MVSNVIGAAIGLVAALASVHGVLANDCSKGVFKSDVNGTPGQIGSSYKAYARGSGGSTCCGECGPALLSGLADQHLVGNRGDAGADAEESIEGCVPCAAPIEAEHELIEVVLQVCPSQAVVNAQAPALEV